MPASTDTRLPTKPEVQRATTLTRLAGEIGAELAAAREHAMTAIQHAMNAGKLLIEAKAAIGHGNYEHWLRTNLGISKQTAAGYVRLFKNRDQIEEGMPLREALKAIAEPRPVIRLTSIPLSADDLATVKSQIAVATNQLTTQHVVPLAEPKAAPPPVAPVSSRPPAWIAPPEGAPCPGSTDFWIADVVKWVTAYKKAGLLKRGDISSLATLLARTVDCTILGNDRYPELNAKAAKWQQTQEDAEQAAEPAAAPEPPQADRAALRQRLIERLDQRYGSWKARGVQAKAADAIGIGRPILRRFLDGGQINRPTVEQIETFLNA